MPRKKETSDVRRGYEYIKANQQKHNVRMMCRLLGVARSGYYAWLKDPVPDRTRGDARLLRLIRASFKTSQGVYGAPRVFLDLREAGETCSKHRVARLMRENNMRAVAVVLDLFSRKVIGWAARQRRLAPVLPIEQARTQHESSKQLLGQRCCRVFLQ